MQLSGLFYVILIFTCEFAEQSKICSGRIRHRNCYLLPPDDQCGLSVNKISPRIIFGSDARLGEFPWMAQLIIIDKGNLITNCGGSLITEKYVITAAHCYKGEKQYLVRLGGHKNDDGDDFLVEDFIVHERYNVPARHNDIALLRLLEAVDRQVYAFTNPICLPMSNIFESGGYENLHFVAAGFGVHVQTTSNEFYPDTMQKVTLALMPLKQCRDIYYYNEGSSISSTMICTSNKWGEDTCNGDSGGPLMTGLKDGILQYYLTGVISFGDEECGVGLPNVHTRVTEYITWILDHIKA